MPLRSSLSSSSLRRLAVSALPLVLGAVACGGSLKAPAPASTEAVDADESAPRARGRHAGSDVGRASVDDASPAEEKAEASRADAPASPPARPRTEPVLRAPEKKSERRHEKEIAAAAPMARPVAPTSPAVAPPPAGGGVLAQDVEPPSGTEHYTDYGVNAFVDTSKDRLSTFAADVDTASYAIARRKLREGTLPHHAGVRVEEFLNSFEYADAAPAAGSTFAVTTTGAPSPYAPGRWLVRVGLKAKSVSAAERAPVHLVYLVDTSGSMMAPDRIELAKKSLRILTETLKPGDTVALCTYAGSVREVLPPTGLADRQRILRAIDQLTAGGSTAMSSGIQLAYDLASRTLVKGHVNRVVVLSDGDANVGPSSHEQILKQIVDYKGRGITLSTVGFGSGNYKDTMMEQLADKGDGNYSYIDGEATARKVFGEQASGLLQVVARDVKIQVELDPSVVRRYRLVGYENRDVADKDFRNDKVDAGEVGAGHAVTALYEVELVGDRPAAGRSPLTVRLRYKSPKNALHGGSDVAREEAFAMAPSAFAARFDEAPESLRFATAVAGFAEVLRESPHGRGVRLGEVERIALATAQGRAERLELVELVRRAAHLKEPSRGAIAPVALAR